MNLITRTPTQNRNMRPHALFVASLALLLSWQSCVAAPANSASFKQAEAGPVAGFKPTAAIAPVPLNIEKIQTPARAAPAANRPALTGDAVKADIAQWVRYLGSPVKAVASTAPPRSENLQMGSVPGDQQRRIGQPIGHQNRQPKLGSLSFSRKNQHPDRPNRRLGPWSWQA